MTVGGMLTLGSSLFPATSMLEHSAKWVAALTLVNDWPFKAAARYPQLTISNFRLSGFDALFLFMMLSALGR